MKEVSVKAYSIKELAVLYNVSTKTLHKWLKPFDEEIGERRSHFYTFKQIRIIFDKIGAPESE